MGRSGDGSAVQGVSTSTVAVYTVRRVLAGGVARSWEVVTEARVDELSGYVARLVARLRERLPARGPPAIAR